MTDPRTPRLFIARAWCAVRSRGRLIAWLVLTGALLALAPRESGFDGPLHLAERFLHGQVFFDERTTWWEMYGRGGRYYLVYAPMASVVLIPYAAVGGVAWGQPRINAFLIALSAAVLWRVVASFRRQRKWADLATLAYVVGTPLLYSATVGNVWLLIHSEGNLFLLAALLAFRRRRWAWAGFHLAMAVCCRHALLFATPLLVMLLWQGRCSPRAWCRFRNRLVQTAAGALVPAVASLALTAAMTGSPWTPTYTLGYREWKTGRLYGTEFLAANVRVYFTLLPTWRPTAPFLTFSPDGHPFWWTSPFLLLIAFARLRYRSLRAYALAAAATFAPYLFFVWNGRVQFGNRYVTDLFPFLFPLAFSALERMPRTPATILAVVATALAAAINGLAAWLQRTNQMGF